MLSCMLCCCRWYVFVVLVLCMRACLEMDARATAGRHAGNEFAFPHCLFVFLIVCDVWQSEVEKLQAAYKKLQEDKEEAIKKVKDSGLALMKAVKAANKKK